MILPLRLKGWEHFAFFLSILSYSSSKFVKEAAALPASFLSKNQ